MGSLHKAHNSHVCSSCVNPVVDRDRASVTISSDSTAEVVDSFVIQQIC